MLKIKIKKAPQYLYDEVNGSAFKVYLQEFTPHEDGGYRLAGDTEEVKTSLEPVAEYVGGFIELISDGEFNYENGNFHGCRLSSRKEFNDEKRSLLDEIMEVTDWDKPLRSNNLRLGDTVSVVVENAYDYSQEIFEDCKIIRLGLDPLIENKGQIVKYLELVPWRGSMWIHRTNCKKQKN